MSLLLFNTHGRYVDAESTSGRVELQSWQAVVALGADSTPDSNALASSSSDSSVDAGGVLVCSLCDYIARP